MLEQKRRVPTILGLVVLLFGIGGGIFFAEYSLNIFNQDKEIIEPSNVRVSNVTDSLASVSWLTDTATVGYIKYGFEGKSLDELAYDDRAEDSDLDKYTLHHVTARGLQPESKYQFVVVINEKEYNNQGKPYGFETFSVAKIGQLGPATGEVKLANGDSAAGSIIYSQLNGATLLSTLVNPDGSWVQPLNISYDLESKLPVANVETRILNIYVLAPNGNKAQALIDTDHDFPAPAIVIGQRHDFLSSKTSSTDAVVLGDTDVASGLDFTLLQPVDNQALNSTRPLIRGKGEPGQKVTVIVESKPQAAVVTVDDRGNWQWTPFRDLMPGLHTVTVKSVSAEGKNVSEARRFIVLKSGSQVLAESTPSASLTPSPTGVLSITPTIITSPTPIFSSPTPATTSGTPISGNISYVVLLLGIGLGLALLGFFPKMFFRQVE